jgi:hypothetical protein
MRCKCGAPITNVPSHLADLAIFTCQNCAKEHTPDTSTLHAGEHWCNSGHHWALAEDFDVTRNGARYANCRAHEDHSRAIGRHRRKQASANISDENSDAATDQAAMTLDDIARMTGVTREPASL